MSLENKQEQHFRLTNLLLRKMLRQFAADLKQPASSEEAAVLEQQFQNFYKEVRSDLIAQLIELRALETLRLFSVTCEKIERAIFLACKMGDYDFFTVSIEELFLIFQTNFIPERAEWLEREDRILQVLSYPDILSYIGKNTILDFLSGGLSEQELQNRAQVAIDSHLAKMGYETPSSTMAPVDVPLGNETSLQAPLSPLESVMATGIDKKAAKKILSKLRALFRDSIIIKQCGINEETFLTRFVQIFDKAEQYLNKIAKAPDQEVRLELERELMAIIRSI